MAPNVLFCFSDQHSAQALGCYGNAQVRTPHLDALAAQGVLCRRAYAQNPICTPSRMSFLSGQYCHNHGYYGLMGPRPARLPSLFSHLKRSGYRTGMAGKIHTPGGWLSAHCDFVADAYGHESSVCGSPSPDAQGLQGTPDDAYQRFLDERGLGHLREDKVIPEWAARNPQRVRGQGLDARPSNLPPGHSVEDWIAQQTSEFIRGAASDKQPFVCWMTMPRPHQTYIPDQRFWDLYDEASLTLPPNANDTVDARHSAAKTTQDFFQKGDDWRLFEPKDWESARRRVLHGYYGCVSQVDDAVGQVMRTLDTLGLRENTLVIYSSDHGEFAGEHGLVEKAPGIGFHCVTRVPMIWSWPGHLPEGVVRDELAESVDVLPTICALAGLEAPDWSDGSDITPLLTEGRALRTYAFTENPLTKTIHSDRYKFTQYLPEMNSGVDFGELFDLENDPWEMHNLYLDPAHQGVVQEMRLALYCWLVRTTRNVTANPVFPAQDGSGWGDWDVAEYVRSEDGKIGPQITRQLIDQKQFNYL